MFSILLFSKYRNFKFCKFFNDDISSIATNETTNYDDLMEPYEIQDEEIFDLSGTFSYLSAETTIYI